MMHGRGHTGRYKKPYTFAFTLTFAIDKTCTLTYRVQPKSNDTFGRKSSLIYFVVFLLSCRAEKIYEDYNQFRAVVSHRGLVHWEPGGKITSHHHHLTISHHHRLSSPPSHHLTPSSRHLTPPPSHTFTISPPHTTTISASHTTTISPSA